MIKEYGLVIINIIKDIYIFFITYLLFSFISNIEMNNNFYR